MISFGAKYIKKVQIPTYTDNGYRNSSVNLVKYDHKNPKDAVALRSMAKYWGEQSLFKDIKLYPDEDLYFITEQKNNFKDLKFKNILGALHFEVFPDNCEIYTIETNPKFQYNPALPTKKYNNIGKTLILYLKDKFKKEIRLFSLSDALPFYHKLGFKHVPQKCHNWLHLAINN